MRRTATSRLLIRHSAGLTRFSRVAHGIRQRARRLRGRERSREALAAHPDERGRPPSSPERLRLQRVDPGSAARGPGAPRRDRARRRDRRDPGAQSLQHRVPRARGLRPRERGRSARPPATGRRSSAATGRSRSRPPSPARRSPAASARASTPARRCTLSVSLAPGETRAPRVPAGPGEGRRRGPRARLAPRLRGGGREPRSTPCAGRGTGRSTRCR